MTRPIPFRAGHLVPAAAAPVTYLADVSEYQPDVADAVYLAWSKAVAVRALYGADHDDAAWYGGQRRAQLHAGGARFLAVYQYLVAGQTGATQAQAFHKLVGAIQPGEVFVADFEEGTKPVLTDWCNTMLSLYGASVKPYLWTYSGLWFGQQQGVLPVEWLADYTAAEPSSGQKLWQFTEAYQVPGVGTADCSLFHGTIDQLAALAYQAPAVFGAPRNLTVRPGDGSVLVQRCDPPAVAPGPVDHYEVSVYTGSYPSQATQVKSYPRQMKHAPEQFGSLAGIPSGTHMTLRATAYTASGAASTYADAHFSMP